MGKQYLREQHFVHYSQAGQATILQDIIYGLLEPQDLRTWCIANRHSQNERILKPFIGSKYQNGMVLT